MVWGQPDEKLSGTFGLFSTICRRQWKLWLMDSGFNCITVNWCLPLDNTVHGTLVNLFQLHSNRRSEWIPAKQHCWRPQQNIFTLSDLRHSFCSQLSQERNSFNAHLYSSWFCLSSADTNLTTLLINNDWMWSERLESQVQLSRWIELIFVS